MTLILGYALLPLAGAMMTPHRPDRVGQDPPVAAPRRGDDDLDPSDRRFEYTALLPLAGAMMTWKPSAYPSR